MSGPMLLGDFSSPVASPVRTPEPAVAEALENDGASNLAAAPMYANLCSSWDTHQDASAAGGGESRKRKSTEDAGHDVSPKRTRAGSRKMPGTPSMLRRVSNSASRVLKTSEELELEKIEQLKAQAKRQKRLSAESFKRVRMVFGERRTEFLSSNHLDFGCRPSCRTARTTCPRGRPSR